MKLYSEYPHASISMSQDEKFKNIIDEILSTGQVKSILESGTFKGLGSTTILADTVVKNNITLNHFFTLEVEKEIQKEAQKNLKKYSFVTSVFGMSLTKDECFKFIEKDDAINNHQNYPEIFIDSITNPKEFYIKEIKGDLSKNKNTGMSFLEKIIGNLTQSLKQNCFRTYIPIIKYDNPIILLDSAGAVGLLEFERVCELMGEYNYYLILDDVHHLKHFRSLQRVKENKKFNILAQDIEQGWVVAKYL